MDKESLYKKISYILDITRKRTNFLNLYFPSIRGFIDLEGASNCAALGIVEEL